MKKVSGISAARVAGMFLVFSITFPTAALSIQLEATLDGAQANAGAGTGSPGTGSATMTFDTATNLFSWNITWQNLTARAIGAHFHGPAPPNQNAGIEVPIGIASPEIGNTILNAAQAADLLAGLWYINIHTTLNPGGEIRGQVLSTITVFTDRAAWEAAAGPDIVNENLESQPLGPFVLGINNRGKIRIDLVQLGLVGPAEVGANAIVRPDDVSTNQWQGHTVNLDFGSDGVNPEIIFTRPVTAFGADWTDTLDNGQLTLAIPGGDGVFFSDHLAPSGDGFLGIVSTAPLSKIIVSHEIGFIGSAEVFLADNLSFSPAYSCGVNLLDDGFLGNQMDATFNLKSFDSVGWSVYILTHNTSFGAPLATAVFTDRDLNSGSRVVEKSFPIIDRNVVGVMSVLSKPDGGIVCSDLQTIDMPLCDPAFCP